MNTYFTKSKYLSGLQCLKRLWCEEKTPERAAEISTSQRRILEQGREVGIKALEYFHDGFQVNAAVFEDAVKQTQELIEIGVPCIFEAAFTIENNRLRCDVLQKEPEGSWKLVEVKSSTKVKDEHLHDAAFQANVLSELGLPISTIELMHINNDCVYPDLTNLFTQEEITSQVNLLVSDVPNNIVFFKSILELESEPDVRIGKHCDKPITCPFKDYCWQNVPDYSIFTIPRISAEKVSDLVSNDIISIFDLPSNFDLNTNQSGYVNCVLSGKADIDQKGITERLSEYEYPIHFLDFETFNPGVPRFDGLKPYQQFPFQFSCHVWNEAGTITHFEYLHTENSDPRGPFVESMVDLIADEGSIVVYYAPFERMILKSLSTFAPQYSLEIESMIGRLVDQMDIFKNHYKHPGFFGSNSLKKVLPVMVPKLSYDGLNVQGGGDAQAIWEQMIVSFDENEKNRLADDLKAYCKLDTLAMVEIHKGLLHL
ncbi:DUF2779 domain-containing protein [Chloroflexota bacterium]